MIHALTYGIPSWDLAVLGASGHGNALWFSALVPIALFALGYGFRRARSVLAGIAIGVAAHLAFFAAVPALMLHYVPHVPGLAALWLGLNAIVCVLLARFALRR